jgi:hypothetical protein
MKRTLFLARSYSPSVVRQLDIFMPPRVASRFLEATGINFFFQDPFQLLGGWRCRLGSQKYGIHKVNMEP